MNCCQESKRIKVWVMIIMVVMVMTSGCQNSSNQPTPTDRETLWVPNEGYVSLIPSLPSMGRILDQELHHAQVDGSMMESICPDLEGSVLGRTDSMADHGDPRYAPSFRGARVKFSYGGFDPVLAVGEVLVARSPMTDGLGTVNDFMGMVKDYPCQEYVDLSSMPANEAFALYPKSVEVIIPLEGLPDRMIGYRSFDVWDTSDPVFQTSDPVSSLVTGRGLVEVYDQVDGYFIFAELDEYSPDPDQSWISLDRIVDLVSAIEDRVRENHVDVEAAESANTCRVAMAQLLELDPATSPLIECMER